MLRAKAIVPDLSEQKADGKAIVNVNGLVRETAIVHLGKGTAIGRRVKETDRREMRIGLVHLVAKATVPREGRLEDRAMVTDLVKASARAPNETAQDRLAVRETGAHAICIVKSKC